MMLGDILAAARASAGTFQAWLVAADPVMAAQIAESAERDGLSTAAWVRSAVADFGSLAGEEDWATLISAIRDMKDPGTGCLLAMVDWRLKAADCGCTRPIPSYDRSSDDRHEPR